MNLLLCAGWLLMFRIEGGNVIVDGRELPVGAVTALLGGPLFILLLRRSQSRSRVS